MAACSNRSRSRRRIRLRVLTDRGHPDTAGSLREQLTQHDIDARVEHTHASLEDVFVVATRSGASVTRVASSPESPRG